MSFMNIFRSGFTRRQKILLFSVLLVTSAGLVEYADRQSKDVVRDPDGLSSLAQRASEALTAINYQYQIYPNHQQYLYDQHKYYRVIQGFQQCLQSSILPDKGFCLHNYITKYPKDMKRYMIEQEQKGIPLTFPQDSRYASQLQVIFDAYAAEKNSLPSLSASQMSSNAV